MPDAMTYDEHDVAAALGRVVFFRGRGIVDQNFVLSVEGEPDGVSLSATVRNADGVVYRQHIWPSRRGGRVSIRSTCTCPVGANCKHVAAALLAHLNSQGATKDLAAPALRPVPLQTDRAADPPAVRMWLERLTRAAELAPAPEPAARRRLHFIIRPTTEAPASLVITAGYVDGSWHPATALHGEIQFQLLQKERPVVQTDVLGDDTTLVRALFGAAQQPIRTPELRLQPTLEAQAVLKRLIATDRVHVGDIATPPLQWAPPRDGHFRWIEQPDGTQTVRLDAVDATPFAHVLALGGPLYIDATRIRIGPIETGVVPTVADVLMRAPPVTAAEATLVRARLSSTAVQHPAARAVPLPEAGEPIIQRRVLPNVRLHLFTGSATQNPSAQRIHFSQPIDITEPVPMARLSFVYSGEEVVWSDPTPMIERRETDGLVVISRDADVEKRALDRLVSVAMRPLEAGLWQLPVSLAGSLAVQPPKPPYGDWFRRALDPQPTIDFVLTEVPKLVAAGWDVTFADDYPFRIADDVEVGWWADAQEDKSGIDWVAFELGVIVDGVKVNIVPHLVQAMTRIPQSILARAQEPNGERLLLKTLEKQRTYAKLADGRLLPLPAKRLAPMLKGMLDLVGPRADRVVDGQVHLHRAETAALARVAQGLGGTVAWAANGAKLVALGDRLLKGRSDEPVLPPPSFRAHLRDYQADGLAWMAFLREIRLGGVLADDMGLGKTVQALAFLAREKAAGRLRQPALIVAPTSVLPNWQAEAARFAPELSVLSLRGADRAERFADIAHHDLVLTTYPLLARDQETLLTHDFHVAILDEAQAIKNPKAAITQVAHRISAAHRFALTGTPLENNLGEVWSLFEFLTPGLLGDESTFRRVFRTPIEKYGSTEAQRFLTQRLKPFLLRRTKQEVATELPPKTEIVERITLEGAQRDLYETVRVMMEKRVRQEIAAKGLAKSHIIVLDALLKMRQVCCDPRLLKLAQAQRVKQSAKLERLMELLPEMVAEGRRILLFSQFTSMLDLIAIELRSAAIPFVTLTGSTEDRAAPVAQFQAGQVPVFLLSLKAGGTGLNLTAADTVIHYDPWWNPAVENQATDRAYRIGQDKPVFVHKQWSSSRPARPRWPKPSTMAAPGRR
jgi:superfamily II DNA or RNA helicase